jgi:ubiquinone biosynthesis protein
VDFLPFELCNELGKLMDKVSPFDADEAIARLHRGGGAAALIDTLFERFEREPNRLGLESPASTGQSSATGEEVAIKVRRPVCRGEVRRRIWR